MMMLPGQGWYLVSQIIHSNKQFGWFRGWKQYWLLRLAKQEISLLGNKTLLCRSLRVATKLANSETRAWKGAGLCQEAGFAECEVRLPRPAAP